ncbi:hypothetical protein NSTCB13_00650 [Nostoc sp. DSM 114160]|jgi:hypothetical protein
MITEFTNEDYGIPSLLQVGSYQTSIAVNKYKRLDIKIVASASINFTLQELVDDWEDISPEVTDNAITKSYSLINTSIIKIKITALEPNTELLIVGQLHS